jgi:hypothetical protein
MKTFISPLYIQTNDLSGEKIACGLIAACESKVYFKYNKDKIDLASKLSSGSIKLLVKNAFELINNNVEKTNSELSASQISLFGVKNNFKKEYIDYLANYASGVIQFNTPKPINVELNLIVFNDLFNKFIGEQMTSSNSDNTFMNEIKKVLHKKELKEKADINYDLNPKSFEGLLKKAKVSLASVNGELSLFQALDFNQGESTVAHKLYELIAIEQAASIYATDKLKKKTSTTLVAVEPNSGTEQKKLFDVFYKKHVKSKAGKIKFVDPIGFETEVEKIAHSKYKKLSEVVSHI